MMFSFAESLDARSGLWCTSTIPAFKESFADLNEISLPSRKILPDDGTMSPARIFARVDFPAPFSPTRA